MAAAAVTVYAIPMEAVWDKDVFGNFERAVNMRAGATSGSDTGGNSEIGTKE
jgi:hypothetical protein